MTIEEIRAFAQSVHNYNVNGLIRPEQQLAIFEAILNAIGTGTVTGLQWNEMVTYSTDLNPYTEAHGRFYKSKVDNNTGNEPPNVRDVNNNYEDAFWKEVSKSDSSSVKEWLPGLYSGGLQIVYYDYAGSKTEWAGVKLWKLDTATRPYESTDINAEIELEDGEGDPIPVWVPAQTVVAAGSTITKIISSAQILDSNTNPVELLPAIDISTGYEIIAIQCKYTYNGIKYTTNLDAEIKFTASASLISIIDLAFAENRVEYLDINKVVLGGLPVVLQTRQGNPTAGDGIIELTLEYKTVSLEETDAIYRNFIDRCVNDAATVENTSALNSFINQLINIE